MIVLFSGGMDSTVLLKWALDAKLKPEALFFEYGQAAASAELDAARAIAQRLGVKLHTLRCELAGGLVPRVSSGVAYQVFDKADPSACVVPARNIVLLSIAAGFAKTNGHTSVAIGCCADDAAAFPDCRGKTLSALEDTFIAAGVVVQIIAPFLDWTKKTIATYAKERGILAQVYRSSSCYVGSSCGTCHACKLRAEALKEAGA